MGKLTFTKQGDVYICPLDTNQLKGTFQIQSSGRGIVSVTANIPDMPPTVIAVLDNPYDNSVIFELDLPNGVEARIKSAVEIVDAQWI